MNPHRMAAVFVATIALVAPAGCATVPATPAPTSTTAAAATLGVTVEPALLARLRRDIGTAVDQGVLVAGTAGEETVVVLAREASEQERAGGGRAASMWIARGDTPFRRAAEYLSYNFTCRTDDPVCPGIRPTGLGFAAVRRQANGDTYVVVAATGNRSVEVTTAEGNAHPVGTVPDGAIVKVNTGQPWQLRIRVTLADGRNYVLMLPPFAVVES